MKKPLLIITSLLFIFCELLEGASASNYSTKTCNSTKPPSIETVEKECIQAINQIRKNQGLPPLTPLNHLTICARKHSQNMASNKVSFGHGGFDARSLEMQKKCNLISFGENVAYNKNHQDPLNVAIQGWMKSPSHKDNIMGSFSLTGVGVALSQDGKFYITQLFATPRL